MRAWGLEAGKLFTQGHRPSRPKFIDLVQVPDELPHLGDLAVAHVDVETRRVVELLAGAPAVAAEYGNRARGSGFVHVASGPMVRSSYHADDFSPQANS